MTKLTLSYEEMTSLTVLSELNIISTQYINSLYETLRKNQTTGIKYLDILDNDYKVGMQICKELRVSYDDIARYLKQLEDLAK